MERLLNIFLQTPNLEAHYLDGLELKKRKKKEKSFHFIKFRNKVFWGRHRLVKKMYFFKTFFKKEKKKILSHDF